MKGFTLILWLLVASGLSGCHTPLPLPPDPVNAPPPCDWRNSTPSLYSQRGDDFPNYFPYTNEIK